MFHGLRKVHYTLNNADGLIFSSTEVKYNGAEESSHFHCTKPHFLYSKLQKRIFCESATKRLFQNFTTHVSKNCGQFLGTIHIQYACQTLQGISHDLYNFMSF
jgi:hypothetical protein